MSWANQEMATDTGIQDISCLLAEGEDLMVNWVAEMFAKNRLSLLARKHFDKSTAKIAYGAMCFMLSGLPYDVEVFDYDGVTLIPQLINGKYHLVVQLECPDCRHTGYWNDCDDELMVFWNDKTPDCEACRSVIRASHDSLDDLNNDDSSEQGT